MKRPAVVGTLRALGEKYEYCAFDWENTAPMVGLHCFLGAIGHPDIKPGILEVGILLKTRFALDQYINLRPVKLYPNVETPL